MRQDDPRCVTAIFLAMAFASSPAGNPAIHSLFSPHTTANSMVACDDWKRAPAVALGGWDGKPAQRTEVRVLWNDDWLFFAFACADRAIVSPGDRDGLDHFRLGDTVEVFAARRGAKDYLEVHATPAGRKTAYFFGDYRQPVPSPDGACRIRVAAEEVSHGWQALIAVPRDLFGSAGTGDEYEIFLGRYDYDAEQGAPALSSYPVQHGGKPDFHRREDYAILRLKP